MRELSLHILDILQNSIAAGATRVIVSVEADSRTNRLTIRIIDNGRGMNPDFVSKVRDPFVTTRTTRKVGLGIPLFAAAAEACDGGLTIESQPGHGTTISTVFALNHIDRAPFGDITSTMVDAIVANPEISFRYEQRVDGLQFSLDTDEIHTELCEVPITDLAVIKWIKDYMTQQITAVGEIG
jgi:anti-sigma regulatory factor (Ser/Thr protein kinase)